MRGVFVMPINGSIKQADENKLDNIEAGTSSIFNLQKDSLEAQIYPNFPLNPLGLFAQTSLFNESTTSYTRLLPSAVYAEPESYKQADATSLAAIAILKKRPELLFQKGIVTDHFGRKIWASAYQLFLGTADTWALKQVHDTIIPKILDGEAQARIQFQEQFPNCSFPPSPDMSEEALYDERNRAQVKQVIDQLMMIVARITVDPCDNGVATLSETTEAIAQLRKIVAPKEDEVIRTGLHFPFAMMDEVFKVYGAQYNPWSVEQLSFYSREVIGSIEAALTAVDGQCYKTGFKDLNLEKGPDRCDGLFRRHPKGIPKEEAPISKQLGDRMFVDPYDGNSCGFSSREGYFNWYWKDVEDGWYWVQERNVQSSRCDGTPLQNLWRTKAEIYGQCYSAAQREVNTASPRR
jgi:hypothetical protein